MDTQVADSLLGALIDGRYRVRARIARGGMATVYAATDERLERTVALKIIHPAHVHERRFVERFAAEAKTIARLTHPNVVAVYDQGTHDGLPYLVMEYVRGRTLREVLGQRRRLNPLEALSIMEQVLAAIAAAHRAGLVHRDVKPENVLVAEAPTEGLRNLVDGVVKVADFGLARAVEASADDTSGGQLMATVAYVAPELVTTGHADPRTDVYAAGIVLFEMLTGRVPFDGDQPVEVAWQHVDQDVPPPSRYVPGLPVLLDDLVARATRRDAGARPTDAGAFLAEVVTARDDLGTAEAATAVMRQVSEQTVMVPSVGAADRPSWARLPDSGGRAPAGRRSSAATEVGWADRLRLLHRRIVRHPRGRLAFAAGLVALCLLLVVGVWWVGFGRYTTAPQLVNLTRTDAAAQASKLGFTVRYGKPQFSEVIAKDVVISQDPPAQGRVVEGGTITLVLSQGPERYTVPDVVGKAYDVAAADLQNDKLTAKRGPDRYDDAQPAGVVVDVNPAIGTPLKPGSTVTVTVSKGRAPIEVPGVVGKNVNDARAQLEGLGLQVVEDYQDSDRPRDEVIAQDPADGSGAEKGAQVTLKVSKGPAQVVVPRVVDQPCQQAKQTLEGMGLQVHIDFNPSGTVRFQNPGENTQVDPGSQVTIGCF